MRPLLLIGLLLAISPAAGAETVYRCPGETGVVFTDEPCAGGERLRLPEGPAPGAAAATRQRTEALAESAETLAEARQQREAERRAEATRRAPPAAQPRHRSEPLHHPRVVGHGHRHGHRTHHPFPRGKHKRRRHAPVHEPPPREPAEERVIGRTNAFED